MKVPEDVPVLAVGAVLGDSDSESMAWSRAIGGLATQVIALRDGVVSPVRLSIAYHVDGRLAPNDFEGTRTGRFDRRAGRLVIQAAVAGHSADKRAVLVSLLTDAIDEAERYVQKKGLAAGLPEIRDLVAKLPEA